MHHDARRRIAAIDAAAISETPDELEQEARRLFLSHLRLMWRRGRHSASMTEMTGLVRAGADRYVFEDDVLRAFAWARARGHCTHDTGRVVLTPDARCVFTLVDQLLERAVPDVGSASVNWSHVRSQVIQALTGRLPRALRIDAPRTVEYLLRARHQIPAESARVLAADIRAQNLTRPAAQLLAEMTALPAATSPNDTDAVATSIAIVRNILGATAA